jgi:4-amino-4-deoxy-L-arabinose transferase-like glycosyltransferase
MTGLTRTLGAWPWALTILLLVFAGTLAFAPGQTTLPPLDREEARTIQMSRQMIETGDYLVPRFQDHAFFAEPPGAHWLQALSAGLLGGDEAPVAAYRLPSFLGAVLSLVLATWSLTPLLGRGGAVVAAFAMGSTALFHVEARLGQIDMPLLVAVLLGQGALARMWLAERASPGIALIFWAALSLGLLIDGPVIALPVLGAALGAAITTRRFPSLAAIKPKVALVVFGLTVTPWLVAISWVSSGAFWADALDGAYIGGLLDTARLGVSPPGTYLGTLLATFWPMAVLLPIAAPAIWRGRGEPAIGFLLGWLLVSLVVLEALPNKALDTSLIIFPALAGLIVLGLEKVANDEAPHPALRSFLVTLHVLPGLALVVATVGAPLWLERVFEPVAVASGAAALALLAVGALALWRWRLDRFVVLASVGAVIAYGGLLHVSVPTLETGLIAPRLAAAEARWRCGATGPVALTTFREPSAVFMLGGDTILADGVGAADALREGRASMAFVGDAVMMEFAAAMGGGGAMALERVDGINPVTGTEVHLTLYAVGREPGHPCAD